jgi:hypothetical protein
MLVAMAVNLSRVIFAETKLLMLHFNILLLIIYSFVVLSFMLITGKVKKCVFDKKEKSY